MNDITNILNNTIRYYESNADNLIVSYELANMDSLYGIFGKNTPPGAKMLDIGFGSGRDLAFFQQRGFEIWGVDPTQAFVDQAKRRFSNIADHFINASLPDIKLPKKFPNHFDYIILIAVWMHLPKAVHHDAIRKICNLLKKNGKIILSYSFSPRSSKDQRHFENIDPVELEQIFKKHHCNKISEQINDDSLNRKILWKTEVYVYDNKY